MRTGLPLGVVCKATEIGQKQQAYQRPGKIIARSI